MYFRDGEMHEVAGRPNNRTKLLQWVEANASYPGANELTYVEFEKCFSCKKGKWKPRKKFKLSRAMATRAGLQGTNYDLTRDKPLIVGRIYKVIPREGERF